MKSKQLKMAAASEPSMSRTAPYVLNALLQQFAALDIFEGYPEIKPLNSTIGMPSKA